jgi:hypothetical protein
MHLNLVNKRKDHLKFQILCLIFHQIHIRREQVSLEEAHQDTSHLEVEPHPDM